MASRSWNPQGRSKALLMECQRYFSDYSEFVTLKQLFYLLVQDGLLRNDEASWRKLKTLTLKARKHGRMDPMAFSLNKHPTETNYTVEADDYLRKMVKDFRIPRTFGQDNYFEIWVEREPLNVFVEHLLSEYDIPVFVTGGYSNYSFTFSAAERIRDSLTRSGSPRILYLSDFSPSSFKMFEILSEELANDLGIARSEMGSILFRGAVLPEHIVKFDLPACYTPSQEKRSKRFEELYGDLTKLMLLPDDACVEVESINPKDLSTIIHNVMFGLLDQSTMAEVATKEAESLNLLRAKLMGN